MNYRQKNWPEWLLIAEFTANNKIHSAIKILLFMTNYSRELRIEVDIERKRKVEKVMGKVGVALIKALEKMKQLADKRRKKAKEWKKRDKVILSIKYLVFKKRLAKKLVDQYVSLYITDKIVSTNVVNLQLLTLMRIHLVMNVS